MTSATYLIGRFKQGSSSAFGILFGRFFADAADLARRRLRCGSPIPEDGEDIAQVVFCELHRAVRQCRPLGDRLFDTRSLLAVLATLTRQQVRRQWRYHTQQCRDVRHSCLATDLSTNGDPDPLDEVLHPAAFRWLRQLESQETIEQLLALLPSGKPRTVAQLLLRGYSLPDIARELDRSVRAVQRYCVEIQMIWQSHPAGQAILRRYLGPPLAGESASPGP